MIGLVHHLIPLMMNTHFSAKGYTILRSMGYLYPEALPVLHFNSFVAPAVPGSDESTYSSTEKQLVAARHAFGTTGNGYFMLQSTKVCMNDSLDDVDNVFLTDKETHSRLPSGSLSLLLHFQY